MVSGLPLEFRSVLLVKSSGKGELLWMIENLHDFTYQNIPKQ